jgi:activating signal cointegrator complex subunit 2
LKAIPTAWKLFKETQDLVFLTFVRMATHKESKVLCFTIHQRFPCACSLKHKFLIKSLIKDCYISPEMFGKLIYDNFIFDVPKLMDLCVLFGPTNSVLLSKMFKNIFVNQPKYKYDLEETAKGLVQVMRSILFFLTANVHHLYCLSFSGFSTHFRSTWSREQSSCWKHSLWAIVG